MEAIKRAMLHAVPLAGSLYRSKADLPVIFYHDIVDGKGYSVQQTSLDFFRRQMAFLKDTGYRTLLFSDLDRDFARKGGDGNREVLVTFDDGYRSNFEIVFPLMKELGLCFNIFINTKMIEEEDPAFLTSSMVSEMHRSGLVEFASHTHSHIDAKEASQELLIQEVLACNARIRDWLGYEPEDFCYPYGSYSDKTHELLSRYYSRIYTSDSKPLEKINGAFVRGRVGIKTYDTVFTFGQKLKGNFDVMYLLYRKRYGGRSKKSD